MALILKIKLSTAVIFHWCQETKNQPCAPNLFEAHSSLAKHCPSSLIWCFSLCPFLTRLSVSSFISGHSSIFNKSHWEMSATSLFGINKLVSRSLTYKLRILLLNWYCLDLILTFSSLLLGVCGLMLNAVPIRISPAFWSLLLFSACFFPKSQASSLFSQVEDSVTLITF